MKTKAYFDKWTKVADRDLSLHLATYFASKIEDPELRLLFKNAAADLDFQFLSKFAFDYNRNLSVSDIRNMRQVCAFFSKNADYGSNDERKTMMLRSFAESEAKNRAYNIWAEWYDEWGVTYTREGSFFAKLSRKISHILSDCPDVESLVPRFGPGSNTTVKRRTTARFKLEASPVCSPNMSEFIKELGPVLMPLYFKVHDVSDLDDTGIGELLGVPKDWKTLRSIIREAVLSTMWQKPIGDEIKQRLLRFGINLYDQSRNRELALLGSLTNEVCTVDVKNASNSLAMRLVYICILDPYWFELLWTMRTSHIDIDGYIHELEMFSSMGNGYTFELESLIFYALAVIATEEEAGDLSLVSVFGDDIIVPSVAYPRLVRYLTLCNFEVNPEKSFADGPFRESCGHDYYFGINIRPFYLKERWTYARLVGFINHLQRQMHDYPSLNNSADHNLLDSLVLLVPEELRNFGPDGFGDGHIIRYYELGDIPSFLTPCNRTKKQTYRLGSRSGYTFSTYSKVPKVSRGPLVKGDLLYPSYSIDTKSHKDIIISDDYARDPMEVLTKGDPYSISGGYKEKLTKVYILSADTRYCFVDPVFPDHLILRSRALKLKRSNRPCYWVKFLDKQCECQDCVHYRARKHRLPCQCDSCTF